MNPKSGHGSFTPTDTCRRHGTGPEITVRKCTFGEACALLRTDYSRETDTFTIRRGVSNGQIIDRTKTGDIHEIPCADAFKPFMEHLPQLGQYFFTCHESKSEGKRYTEKLLRKYWKQACEAAGEDIDVYRGTKTSRASQMLNEDGVSIYDLQIAGDWASLSSVTCYARANIAKKRAVLNNVVPMRHPGGTSEGGKQ